MSLKECAAYYAPLLAFVAQVERGPTDPNCVSDSTFTLFVWLTRNAGLLMQSVRATGELPHIPEEIWQVARSTKGGTGAFAFLTWRILGAMENGELLPIPEEAYSVVRSAADYILQDARGRDVFLVRDSRDSDDKVWKREWMYWGQEVVHRLSDGDLRIASDLARMLENARASWEKNPPKTFELPVRRGDTKAKRDPQDDTAKRYAAHFAPCLAFISQSEGRVPDWLFTAFVWQLREALPVFAEGGRLALLAEMVPLLRALADSILQEARGRRMILIGDTNNWEGEWVYEGEEIIRRIGWVCPAIANVLAMAGEVRASEGKYLKSN